MLSTIATIFLWALLVWLLFEAWRAPHFQQDAEGNWHQIRPTKKLKDLFKRKK